MADIRLGIDLGPYEVKLVEVEQQAKTSKVLNWSINYFPSESENLKEAQVKALVSALRNSKIRTRKASVVILGSDLVYKLIDLPVMPAKEVPSALKYKLESLLSFPAGEAVIDYYKIEGSQLKDKQLFFVVAIPKKNIINVIEILKRAGLSLKNLIPPSSALENALQVASSDPHALVYLGKYSSIIVLVKNEQIVFAREVKVGADSITQSMVGVVQTESSRLELDYAKAEEIKSTFGVPLDLEEYSKQTQLPAAEIMAMMRPALEKIGAEIIRTFEYYREETADPTEFKKIYFSGGGSKTKNLLEYYQQGLDRTVAPIPYSVYNVSVEGKDFEEAAPFLTLALGAAVPKAKGLSLLPAEYEHVFINRVKKWINFWSLGLIYLIILALVWMGFYLKQNKLNQSLILIQKQLRMHGIGIEQKSEAVKELAALMEKLGAREKGDRFINIMQALDKITPSDVYFENLNYDNQSHQLLIKGVVLSRSKDTGFSIFIQQLSKTTDVGSVDLSYLKESDKYSLPTYDFEIKCLLAGEKKK